MFERLSTVTQKITIRIDNETRRWLESEAKEARITLSEVVRLCCQDAKRRSEGDASLPMTLRQFEAHLQPVLERFLTCLFSIEGMLATKYEPEDKNTTRLDALKWIDERAFKKAAETLRPIEAMMD